LFYKQGFYGLFQALPKRHSLKSICKDPRQPPRKILKVAMTKTTKRIF